MTHSSGAAWGCSATGLSPGSPPLLLMLGLELSEFELLLLLLLLLLLVLLSDSLALDSELDSELELDVPLRLSATEEAGSGSEGGCCCCSAVASLLIRPASVGDFAVLASGRSPWFATAGRRASAAAAEPLIWPGTACGPESGAPSQPGRAAP